MLTVHHLSKSFDHQTIFEDVTFSLNPGERVGLIGPNGCGKTTLLRILVGQEQADEGHINKPSGLRIGYLAQGFEFDLNAPLQTVIDQAVGQPELLEDELAKAAMALAQSPNDAKLQASYDLLLRRLAASHSQATLERKQRILAGLGLAELDPHLPISTLSGGQLTRLALGIVLLGEPQLLLLDEPTNHLDIQMLEWLEDWIVHSPCTMLIVSHDRTFLDRTVTRILDLSPRYQSGAWTITLREYNGNYSAYLEQYQAEIERQWSEYKDQELEIQRQRQDIARAKAQAAYTERQASSIRIGGADMKMKGYKSYQQGIAKKVARKAKAREKKLERYVDSDERVEKPIQTRPIKLEFGETTHQSRLAIQLERLGIGYHPQSPLLENLNLILHGGQRVVLSGPNGSGKTTLLRTIAGELTPLQGQVKIGPNIRLGYLTQDQSDLNSNQTALESMLDYFTNETEARTFLSYYLLTGDEPLKPIWQLSYGQRTRLMLALLVTQGCNCLLMDEPVNHLDIPSRAQFEQALSSFDGAVLAVVHDRYFIQRFAQEIWWVEKGGIRREYTLASLQKM